MVRLFQGSEERERGSEITEESRTSRKQVDPQASAQELQISRLPANELPQDCSIMLWKEIIKKTRPVAMAGAGDDKISHKKRAPPLE